MPMHERRSSSTLRSPQLPQARAATRRRSSLPSSTGSARAPFTSSLLLSAILFLALSLIASPAAHAMQLFDTAGLRPDRAYYGIKRPVPMTVDLGFSSTNTNTSTDSVTTPIPSSEPETPGPHTNTTTPTPSTSPSPADLLQQAEILLIDPAAPPTAEPIARAPIKPTWAEPSVRGSSGATLTKVDLSDLFPIIWTDERPRVLYAQLAVAGARRGPPVILQPMIAPRYAPRVDRNGTPLFTEPENRRRTLSGIRAWSAKSLVMETTLGQIEFTLRADLAPNTVWHFMHLVREGFYTDIPIHRIASLTGKPRPDIVQAGDPIGNGLGGPGFYIDLEPSTLPHDFGVLSMARMSDPNSNGSQFFIALSREGTRALDGQYTAFAQLIRGEEALGAIAKSPVGPDQRPTNPPIIQRMWLADAPPAGLEPKPIPDPYIPASGR